MKPFLEAGQFTTTHGIAGELRLYPWCNEPAFLAKFATLYLDDAGKTALPPLAIRPHKNLCLVKMDGVDSIEAARPYIGRVVYLSREEAALPPGTFFVQDLLGAHLQDTDTGEVYGTVAAITHPGRHDVYEVQRPGGQTVLFPAAPPFIHSISAEDALILVRPIEGMFPPEEDADDAPRKKAKRRPPATEETPCE